VKHESKPVVLVFPASDGVGSNAEHAFAEAESRIEKMSLWKEPPAEVPAEIPAEPAEPAAPVEVVARATRLLEQRRLPVPIGVEWRRPAAALAAAAGLTVGVFLVASRISLPAPAPVSAASRASNSEPSGAAGVASPEPPAPSVAVGVSTAALTSVPAGAVSAASFGDVVSGPSQFARAAAARRALVVRPELRRPTEELRLRAALARIEADRVNARETARDVFGEGRNNEEEGERLLRAQEYESAQLAFSRAARLFQKAQELSWEERVRKASLGGGSEGSVSK
jgi:hypothetical protein